MAQLVFPQHYRPRPYQNALHEMWRTKRFGVAVLPRQSGKDVGMSMEMVQRRLEAKKTTGAYISLDNPMIRDILWQKTYNDPVTNEYVHLLQDNVPAQLVTQNRLRDPTLPRPRRTGENERPAETEK